MIVPLIVVGCIVWLSLQGRDSRTKVWARRIYRVQSNPFYRMVRNDLKYLITYPRRWIEMRNTTPPDFIDF